MSKQLCIQLSDKCPAVGHLIGRARKQYAKLQEGDRENALRGLFLGGLLWQIKDAAGAGNFLRVLKEQMPDIPRQRTSELMRLWLVFAAQAEIAQTPRLALPDPSRALVTKAGATGSEIVRAALKFVGDLSLHALMLEHDVRGTEPQLGGARGKKGGKPKPALDAEQLYLFSRDEISGALDHAKQLLVRENKLQYLAGHPEEIAGVVADLRELADKVEAAAKPLLKKTAQS